jgi:hypothetical protein
MSLKNALGLALTLTLAASATAQTTYTYKPPTANNNDELQDLDHHRMATWRLQANNATARINATNNYGVMNLNGGYISAASLTFRNIYNWNAGDNRLFVWLLDTARGATTGNGSANQVRYFVDDPNQNNQNPSLDIRDDFNHYYTTNAYDNNANFLLATPNGVKTAGTKLGEWYIGQQSNRGAAVDANGNLTYQLNDIQLNRLTDFIANGNDFALGFDPDCHYWNDGVEFKVTVSPGQNPRLGVPEPATGLFLLLGAGLLASHRRKK